MLDPSKVQSYDYELPSELIAKEPVTPPERARLLIYERKSDRIIHTTFQELPAFLPPKSHLIFNDTKVIKARIYGKKSSSGKIELLLNRPLANNRFSVFIRGRVKVGTKLHFHQGVSAKVEELCQDGSRIVTFYKDKILSFQELLPILEEIGHTPLPPYIDRADTKEDETNYQPIFAQKPGAVAAPTASLHFSSTLIEQIKTSHPIDFITLHVGAGTFKPVEVEDITHHRMHSEYYEVPPATQKVITSSVPIVAVGTTVTRTVEYFWRTKRAFGECDLFLHPLNPPQRVNHLITNFHLPKSTLLMLVASFIGSVEKTLDIYNEAIARKYRFYSYGDGMFII